MQDEEDKNKPSADLPDLPDNEEDQEESQDPSSEQPSDKSEEEIEEAQGEEQDLPTDQEDPPAPEEPPEEDPKPVSHRENKRIKALTEKLASQQQNKQEQPPKPSDLFVGDKEYTPEEANERARAYGTQQYESGLAAAKALEFRVSLELDAPKVASRYDFMNTDSEKYDPGITEFINATYLKLVGYDPTTGVPKDTGIRYAEFVDGWMEGQEAVAALRNANSSANLAKQASQTGVRPNTVTKKTYQGDDPREMSDSQLEQVINSALRIKK
jgi:hypothetical protein